jgi:NAD-dependent deacetylase
MGNSGSVQMIDKLWFNNFSKTSKIVALTGAGVSRESGVPTFRDNDGLWKKFKPEELASFDAFIANPDLVWEWYQFRRELIHKVKPNAGHFALAKIEALMPNFTLITQNVDNLHRRAGSQNVLEIHGNIDKNYCLTCKKRYDGISFNEKNAPRCDCGGLIRPDVVWFGEMLPEKIIQAAFRAAEEADIFLSIGTSAYVYPAANLPVTAKIGGATLIEINPQETPLSSQVHHFIKSPSGEALPELYQILESQFR